MIRLFIFLFCLSYTLYANSELNEACLHFEEAFSKPKLEKKAFLDKSVSGFKRYIQKNNIQNPYLEFNLGTVNLYQENFGEAILHLKRAHAMEPDNSQIVSNLLRAGRIIDTPLFSPSKKGFSNILKHYWNKSSLMFWQILTMTLSLLFLLKTVLTKKCGFLYKAFTFIVLFGLSFCVFFKAEGIGNIKEVVLQQAYNPKAGVSDRYPSVLEKELVAGACGELKRKENGWVEIAWHGGFSGWVPEEKIDYVFVSEFEL